MAYGEVMKRDSQISQLEHEVGVYQANHKMMADQMRELQQANMELRQQVGRSV